MEKIHKNRTRNAGAIPKKPKPVSTVQQVPSGDVERVLEHVTSPFRWELLEVPAVKPKVSIPRASGNHKSRSK